jgi:hypothetical protein
MFFLSLIMLIFLYLFTSLFICYVSILRLMYKFRLAIMKSDAVPFYELSFMYRVSQKFFKWLMKYTLNTIMCMSDYRRKLDW